MLGLLPVRMRRSALPNNMCHSLIAGAMCRSLFSKVNSREYPCSSVLKRCSVCIASSVLATNEPFGS